MVLFESLDTLSYSPSVLTMALSWALSCIVCEIERLIGRKSGNFYTHLHLAPRKGRPCWNSQSCLIHVKLERLRYGLLKKLWQYIKPFP